MSDSKLPPALRVIVIGCGIAGPPLACLLKRQGFDPIIYERMNADAVTTVGASLMLQLNGLKVLNLVSPETVKQLTTSPHVNARPLAHVLFKSELTGQVLAQADWPAWHRTEMPSGESTPLPFQAGVRRGAFQQMLIDLASNEGVAIHFEKELTGIAQTESNVTATFSDGTHAVGSFLIGCDGIHSGTRTALFGKQAASYTGLTQTAGLSPTPTSWRDTPTLLSVFGVSSHFISYPISDTMTSWACSMREEESRETWKAMGKEQHEAFRKESQWAGWSDPVGELVRTPEKVIKYGLYDRPELKTWHQDRVVLVGDAAHPTSPHLGQGANQAMEDIYHLTRLFSTHMPTPSTVTDITTELLKSIFTDFETLRIARTSALVKGARAMGETRVVEGREACLARDERVMEVMSGDAMTKAFGDLLVHPF